MAAQSSPLSRPDPGFASAERQPRGLGAACGFWVLPRGLRAAPVSLAGDRSQGRLGTLSSSPAWPCCEVAPPPNSGTPCPRGPLAGVGGTRQPHPPVSPPQRCRGLGQVAAAFSVGTWRGRQPCPPPPVAACAPHVTLSARQAATPLPGCWLCPRAPGLHVWPAPAPGPWSQRWGHPPAPTPAQGGPGLVPACPWVGGWGLP